MTPADNDRQKWDARYQALAETPRERAPSPWLDALDDLLPRRGRALDAAGGAGRNAFWLARRGLDVTVADISPVALALALRDAEAERLALTTVQADLESGAFPSGPWDVVVVVDFLWRPLFASAAAALAPGGFLVVAHPTESNLQRHPRPGHRHLLRDGELPGLVEAAGLEILRSAEGWQENGRHETRLAARRQAN